MTNPLTTFIQPAAAPSAQGGNNTAGASKANANAAVVGGSQNAQAVGNTAATQGADQSTFSKLIGQQNLVTVTPELAGLIDGLEVGQIINLDELQNQGVDLQAFAGAADLTSQPLVQNHQVLGSTQNIENKGQSQYQGLLGSRDNTSQQPITDILSRIPNAQNLGVQSAETVQTTNQLAGESNAAIANQTNNLTNNIAGAQVARPTEQTVGGQTQGNKLAEIAKNAQNIAGTAKEQVAVSPLNNRSANTGLLSQSLFTANSEAVMSSAFASTQQTSANGEFLDINPASLTDLSKSGSLTEKVDPTLVRAATTSHTPASSQVSVKIAHAVQTGANKIEIQLDPANLGKVHVQIDVNHDGKATVIVLAEKNETLDMLKSDSRALEQALKNAGLSTDAGGLEFGLKDQSDQQFANERNKQNGANNQGLYGENDGLDIIAAQNAYTTYQSNQALNILA
jgi:flagellar hook-length control protein FliK